jgi:hypothetical protein
MAAAEEFKLRAELNYEFLPDQYPYKVADEESVVLREDYDGRVDVIPISDPNIFSSTQRIAQGQALVELADNHPNLYNQREAHERFLKAIRIPDWEDVLVPEQQPVRKDPVQENMGFLQNQGANAFIDQDHDAHIAVHINFINGLNEQALEIMGPIVQAHLAEHYSFKYFVEMQRAMGGQLPMPGQYGPEQPLDPEMENQIARMAAQVPQIQIMEPGQAMDEDSMSFEAEEARKDAAHEAEMRRKDEAAIAEMRRKELEVLSKEEREDWIAEQKKVREDQAAQAKAEREDMLAKAKAARERKAAATRPKPKAQ